MATLNLRTQVGIVGAGPAGLLLSHLLHLHHISSIVIESRSRAHVENRIRAGQLEPATVQLLIGAGLGTRLQALGLSQTGVRFLYDGIMHRLDLESLINRFPTIYGQQEIVKDLIKARIEAQGVLLFEASNVVPRNFDGQAPVLTFEHEGYPRQLHCDFIAGCDGFHGVCRPAIASALSITERESPFGWLGIVAEAPPISKELIYSCHERGLALFSLRSSSISRLYLQCASNANINEWTDECIWDELRRRLDGHAQGHIAGCILEKTVVRMRSFVADPLQSGRLFLAGDAAHIVPPSAAKGLNLAIADVHLLARAFAQYYRKKDECLLNDYSKIALPRIWEGQRFSQWMTRLLHRFENGEPFERKLQLAELDNVFTNKSASMHFAESYVGPPLTESDFV